MDAVFHPADENGRAIELFGNAAELRIEGIARGFVAQERSALFAGEGQTRVSDQTGARRKGFEDKFVLPRHREVGQGNRAAVG
jgi:hypothetical protein